MRDAGSNLAGKWVAILVPTLGLALGCLMGPGAFLLKLMVKEVVRQELGGYQTIASADAKWKAHRDFETDVFRRWERDLAALREQPTFSDTNHARLLLEISSRLTSLETRLKQTLSDPPRTDRLVGEQPGP